MASVSKGDTTFFIFGQLLKGTVSFKPLATEPSLKILSFKDVCFSMPQVPDAHLCAFSAGWPTVTCGFLHTQELQVSVQLLERSSLHLLSSSPKEWVTTESTIFVWCFCLETFVYDSLKEFLHLITMTVSLKSVFSK